LGNIKKYYITILCRLCISTDESMQFHTQPTVGGQGGLSYLAHLAYKTAAATVVDGTM